MRSKWVIILGISLMMLVGCAAENSTPNTQPQEEQKAASDPDQIYQNSCASCHGGNLQGGYGPSLENLSAKYTAEEVQKIIQEGKGSMPSQSHIPQPDQQKLAAWLIEKK